MNMLEEDYLMISGIQHYLFCRRQWALIHIENLWEENYLTAEGRVQHEKAHDTDFKESRKDTYVVRGLKLVSHELHIVGECDVVEFRKNMSGFPIKGKEGLWLPFPIEYKHGSAKTSDEDKCQLCAEAMCLEEMLCCSIPYGYLYYQKTKRREKIEFTEELRNKVKNAVKEMEVYMLKQYTPNARKSQKCNSCSLRELCLPKLSKKKSVSQYIRSHLTENA